MKITTEVIQGLRQRARLPKFAADKKENWLAHLHWPLFLFRPEGADKSMVDIRIIPIDELEPLQGHAFEGLLRDAATYCFYKEYSVSIHKGPPPPEYLALECGKWSSCRRTVSPRFIIQRSKPKVSTTDYTDFTNGRSGSSSPSVLSVSSVVQFLSLLSPES